MKKVQYQTQEEKYLSWYDDAVKNRGLIDVKFHIGNLQETDIEEFYREANHFNEQMDRQDLAPRIEVNF